MTYAVNAGSRPRRRRTTLMAWAACGKHSPLTFGHGYRDTFTHSASQQARVHGWREDEDPTDRHREDHVFSRIRWPALRDWFLDL